MIALICMLTFGVLNLSINQMFIFKRNLGRSNLAAGLAVALLMLGINACQKSEEEAPNSAPDKTQLVAEAQNYLQEQTSWQPGQNLGMGTANSGNNQNKGRKALSKYLNWQQAGLQQFSFGLGLVVPVDYPEGYQVLGDKGYSRSLSQLSYAVVKPQSNGSYALQVVTTLPDQQYLASEVPKVFTGTVLVEDWKGNYLKGFRYTTEGVRPLLNYTDEATSESKEGSNSLRTETTNDFATCYYMDYYSCAMDGEEIMYETCQFMYSEFICEEPQESGGIPRDNTHTDYPPSDGTKAGGSIGSEPDGDTPKEFVDCGIGYLRNYRGECECPEGYMIEVGDRCLAKCADGFRWDENLECIKIEQCLTGDPILDGIQAQLQGIWGSSNGVCTYSPLEDRIEQGGWIVEENGVYSIVPFPESAVHEPCQIAIPLSSMPPNAVGIIHSHPYFQGEDIQSICGEGELAQSYNPSPSNTDFQSMLMTIVPATQNFNFMGYVVDGNNISSYNMFGQASLQQYQRCGY